jgi:patatin-like phospholipase/acyl hydrolase
MNILSLNGGGSLGYASCKLLQHIELATGKQCYEIFDLIGSLSTGSIIAAMLAKGEKAGTIADFYRQKGPLIFKDPKCTFMNLFFPKYNKKHFERILKEELNIPFSAMKTKVMIYACRIDKPNAEVRFFKSWRDRDFNLNTADIVQASSSAPTYFAPKTLDGGIYVDGSLYCNNPSMCSIIEATKLGSPLTDIYNVNIELDKWTGVNHANKLDSIIEWATNIWNISSSLGERANENLSHSLLGFRHHKILANSGLPIDSLDFDRMDKIAEAAWEEHKGALIDWLGKI